jgi:hypothetical protein
MPSLLTLSLSLNVAVLVPVCAGLISDARWTRSSYGARSPARGILLAIYLTLCGASLLLLVSAPAQPAVARALLMMQVVYKLATPLTARTLRNAVVLSNVAIAAVHTVTLVLTRG